MSSAKSSSINSTVVYDLGDLYNSDGSKKKVVARGDNSAKHWTIDQVVTNSLEIDCEDVDEPKKAGARIPRKPRMGGPTNPKDLFDDKDNLLLDDDEDEDTLLECPPAPRLRPVAQPAPFELGLRPRVSTRETEQRGKCQTAPRLGPMDPRLLFGSLDIVTSDSECESLASELSDMNLSTSSENEISGYTYASHDDFLF